MNLCAKGIKNEISCLDIKDLKIICEAYNKEMLRKNKKDYIPINIIESKNKKVIFDFLLQKFNCKDEVCIIKNKIIENIKNNELLYQKFKPEGPLNHDWLSNWDIDLHMLRFQNYYNCLLYTGTVSIDFNQDKMFKIYKNVFNNNSKFNKISCFYHYTNKCTVPEYGSGTIVRDKSRSTVSNENKINCIATIYNTSKRSEPGQHWIASFVKKINDDEIKMYFFDSVGHKPPSEIKQFFKLLENNLFTNYKIDKRYNNIQHQFKNSECGVYCIDFIDNMTSNPNSFEKYILKKTSDDEMYKNRFNYFRPIVA